MSPQHLGPLNRIFRNVQWQDLQTKILDFQMLGTLGMMKAKMVIKGQLIFARIVLIVEKF